MGIPETPSSLGTKQKIVAIIDFDETAEEVVENVTPANLLELSDRYLEEDKDIREARRLKLLEMEKGLRAYFEGKYIVQEILAKNGEGYREPNKKCYGCFRDIKLSYDPEKGINAIIYLNTERTAELEDLINELRAEYAEKVTAQIDKNPELQNAFNCNEIDTALNLRPPSLQLTPNKTLELELYDEDPRQMLNK